MSLLVIQSLRSIARRSLSYSKILAAGDPGSGTPPHGGGYGGSVREGGGKFGEIEAAQEATYFKKLERKQLENLKKHHDEEIHHHEEEIQRHLDSIKRHREKMANLADGEKKPKSKKEKGYDSD